MNMRHCGYAPCSVPLTGKSPLAQYCCRSHKESARRQRRMLRDVHWLCDQCGVLYLGTPPTCPAHTTR